jgi:hypothetical protein
VLCDYHAEVDESAQDRTRGGYFEAYPVIFRQLSFGPGFDMSLLRSAGFEQVLA